MSFVDQGIKHAEKLDVGEIAMNGLARFARVKERRPSGTMQIVTWEDTETHKLHSEIVASNAPLSVYGEVKVSKGDGSLASLPSKNNAPTAPLEWFESDMTMEVMRKKAKGLYQPYGTIQHPLALAYPVNLLQAALLYNAAHPIKTEMSTAIPMMPATEFWDLHLMPSKPAGEHLVAFALMRRSKQDDQRFYLTRHIHADAKPFGWVSLPHAMAKGFSTITPGAVKRLSASWWDAHQTKMVKNAHELGQPGYMELPYTVLDPELWSPYVRAGHKDHAQFLLVAGIWFGNVLGYVNTGTVAPTYVVAKPSTSDLQW